MLLLQTIILLIVVGILLWIMNAYIPMDPTVKKITNILIIVVVVLWLLKIFSLLAGLSAIRV